MLNSEQLDLGQRNLKLPRRGAADACEESLTTTFDDNLGSYGNMFDIQTFDKNLIIYGIDFYTDITTEVFYEMYTKRNSFKDDGGKVDVSAWTLLKKGSTLGAGWGMGTPVRDFEIGDLIISANEKRSFYITLNSTDMRYRNIQGDMPTAVVGDTYKRNGALEVQVGVSLDGYPLSSSVHFFGRRAWSGTLHYTTDRTCSPSANPTDLESESPTLSPTRVPTPTPTLSPTGLPTLSPSAYPTSVAETSRPTVLASAPPTLEPTTSDSSELPSESLSGQPSPRDTLAPSAQPTPGDTSSSSPQPSSIDSLSPSLSPTRRPTPMSLSPSRTEEVWECTGSSVVKTTLDGGTGAYGNMFTVTAKERAVKITTLSFHTDYFEEEVTTMVYTRMGDFVGYENKAFAWRKICESSLRGGGGGYPSMIPVDDFESVSLASNETAAFYITLTTADIRYSKPNVTLGEPIASHEYLDVNAGVGLADFPFASDFFLYAPRAFNGMVHFNVEAECLPILSQIYSFNVHHPANIFGSELYRLIGSRIEAAARSLMDTQEVLIEYAKNHSVSVDSAIAESADGSCNPFSSMYICTPIDATLFLKHAESLRPGKLKYQWLTYYEEITLNVNLQFQAEYVGDIPVQSGLKLLLNSNTAVSEMSAETSANFEMALVQFLISKLTQLNVTILDAEVTEQAVKNAGDDVRRFLQRSDDDSVSSPTATIDISTNIVGEYRPPPEIDFSGVVDDAIDGDPAGLEQSIRRSDTHFDILESIESRPVITDDSSKETENQSIPVESSSMTMLLIIVLVCVVAAFLLFVCGTLYLRRKRRKRGKVSVNPIVQDSSILDRRGKKNMFGNFGRSTNNKEVLMEANVAWADVAQVDSQDPKMTQDARPQSLYESRRVAQPYRDDPNGGNEFRDEGGYSDNPNHDSHHSNSLQGSRQQPFGGVGYRDQEGGNNGAYQDNEDGAWYGDDAEYDKQGGYDDQRGYDDEAHQ